MRILIAHEALAGGGGVESYLETVMPAMQQAGHELAFLHFNPSDDRGPTRLEFPGIETIGVSDLGPGEALRRVRGWRPDACFVHNMRHLAVDEALLAIAPVVKMMHGYFGTCISGRKCHAFPGVTPCTRTFGAACLALYLPRRCGQMRPLTMVRQFDWNTRQRRLFGRYAAVVVASRHMADEYRRHGVAPERLITAPLFPTTTAGAEPRATPGEPMVLFAGRMTDLKGPRVLLHAIAAARRRLGAPVPLVMAGEGPEREPLRRLAAALDLPVTFPGWVQGAERVALMRRATMVAIPSLWPEPFGLVGLEAAMQGVPAVAFDVGGIGDWLRDGVNGRVVRPTGDASAFGAAIASILADRRELIALEQGAIAMAGDLSLARHLAIIDAALARAGGRPAASA